MRVVEISELLRLLYQTRFKDRYFVTTLIHDRVVSAANQNQPSALNRREIRVYIYIYTYKHLAVYRKHHLSVSQQSR